MVSKDQITIVGLGLIGGSLGMAIRRKRLAKKVIGFSRKSQTLRLAKRKGAIDSGTCNLKAAVSNADIVVLAGPVDTIAPLAKRIEPWVPRGCIITDVGSTKADIVSALTTPRLKNSHFVGGHPLAGSDKHGIRAADGHLFEGSVFVLTPVRQTNQQALRRILKLWKPLVGYVIKMSPKEHDRVLAGTSHLPHLLGYNLAIAINTKPLPRAPRSFLQTTRFAKCRPDLWDDIFLANRKAMLDCMNQFDRDWKKVRKILIRSDRKALNRWLKSAHDKRHALKD